MLDMYADLLTRVSSTSSFARRGMTMQAQDGFGGVQCYMSVARLDTASKIDPKTTP